MLEDLFFTASSSTAAVASMNNSIGSISISSSSGVGNVGGKVATASSTTTAFDLIISNVTHHYWRYCRL
jgi:hypothetical protein